MVPTGTPPGTEELELDPELERLTRKVRKLVRRGELAKMQEVVAREAARRQVDSWTLTRQIAAAGFALGLAKPIAEVAAPESID